MAALAHAWVATGATTPLYVRLDWDDPALGEYISQDRPKGWEVAIGDRVRMAGAMRECFARYPDERVYGFIGDDTVPLTDQWDAELELTAIDRGMAFPDDGARQRPTHPVVRGDLVRAMGFWALPGLVHIYTDTALSHVGWGLGCLTPRMDVKFDHRHWSTGRAERTGTYLRDTDENDRAVYQEWMATGFAPLIERLRPIVT